MPDRIQISTPSSNYERSPVGLDELARLGVFVHRHFLTRTQCDELCTEMMQAPRQPAAVSTAGISEVNERIRRSQTIAVKPETLRTVHKALEHLRSELEKYFEERLGNCQEPVFLAYREGDFFRAHCDNAGDPRQPAQIQARRVSIVIFLSGSDIAFRGGALNLYRLTQRPTWDNFCLPLTPEAGLLIAFRASITHEVTTVTCGERFSVITWFNRAD